MAFTASFKHRVPATHHLQGGLSHRAVRGEARTDRDSVVLALTSDLGSSADVMPSSSGGGGLKVGKCGQTGKWSYSEVKCCNPETMSRV